MMIGLETEIGKQLQKHAETTGEILWDVADDIYTRRTYGRDLWPRNLIRDRDTEEPREPLTSAVVWPKSKKGVSALIKLAQKMNWEVYPFGAGSGVCGGVTPTHEMKRPRIVVDLKKLDRIEAINAKSQVAVVQAGIMGQVLEEDLNARGYTMGHFPSSIYCSTFGGYLATRAAGQLSTYYGKMEDIVLSVEGVLPNGDIFQTTAAPKTSTGPDWNHVFVGSEGSLGILTAATVKIHKLPEQRLFMSWVAPSSAEALEGIRSWLQEGLRPAVVRLYDEDESRLLHEVKAGVRVLAIVEGEKELSEFTARRMETLIAKRSGWINKGEEPAQHWWSHRYAVSYRQQQIMSHRRMILDTFEVAALWDNLPQLHRAVKDVVDQFSGKNGMLVVLAHFSHFYHCGGNIYFTLCGRSPEELEPVEFYDRVWDALLEACLKAGGAVSHHHGIGRLKAKAKIQQQGVLHNLLKSVKHELDPQNIFNPENLGL